MSAIERVSTKQVTCCEKASLVILLAGGKNERMHVPLLCNCKATRAANVQAEETDRMVVKKGKETAVSLWWTFRVISKMRSSLRFFVRTRLAGSLVTASPRGASNPIILPRVEC
jgi:hypothetical protein